MKRISLWFILSIMAVFVLAGCNIQSVDEYQKQVENETAVNDNSEIPKTKTISEESGKEKQVIDTESEESAENKELQTLVDAKNKKKKGKEENSISTKTETASKTVDNKNQAENHESDKVTKNQPKDKPVTSSEKVSEKKAEKQEPPQKKETKSTKEQEKSKVVEKPKTEKPKSSSDSNKKYVTISIRVDTILDNMDRLDPSLKSEKYVPKNGVILNTKKYELKENKEENVFDILVRATNEHRIQMEYQGASENQYGSVYIEGINHLYEFSVGELSGWMYSVNDWYPNYGASKYKLKDGDKIEWNYTCDLGRDLGVTWLE